MQTLFRKGLVWFRRDLRTEDNAALTHALACCDTVYCVFVFDTDILHCLPAHDRRVQFIHESVEALAQELQALSPQTPAILNALHASAVHAIPALAKSLGVDAVFAGRDYEPAATSRDTQVQQLLRAAEQQLVLVKDHVAFEEREILTQAGRPYTVFTPYHKAWLARCTSTPPSIHHLPANTAPRLASWPAALYNPIPTLTALGFVPTNLHALGLQGGAQNAQRLLADFAPRMHRYDQTRDFPARKGPSYLGVHLRFGTISVRKLVAMSMEEANTDSTGAATWLAELAWRDFYFQIIANFPHAAHAAFKPEYDNIAWEDGVLANQYYQAWCEGRTGYPIVDAAMAQLNQTGYMHNRLRMVAGSFLVKHLGIDWRWGEKYFALHLNDFDLCANNGGWQWVASSGCDAQPYFRIFNPITQSKKFDAQGGFIRRYLPQLAGLSDANIHAPWCATPLELESADVRVGDNYPAPLVDHAQARAKTLVRYGIVKKPASYLEDSTAQ